MLEITWCYTPADFFEADLTLPILNGNVVLAEGGAKFTTHAPFVVSRDTIGSVTEHLRAILDARLVLVGGRYTLSEPQFVEIDANNRLHYTLFVDSVRHEVRVDNVDLIVTAQDGTIISDSRQERISSEAGYVSKTGLAASNSSVVRRMLSAYRRSFEDPSNSLVYLYEIRDAAAEYFGSKTQALKALRVSERQWNRLGELANVLPLSEGRHRGEQSELRAATDAELREARDLSRIILDAFAVHVINERGPGERSQG